MGLAFEPMPSEEFNSEIIEKYFAKYEDPLAIFKGQESAFENNDPINHPSKRHHKKPGSRIIREARTDHSSKLAEIEHNIVLKKIEKELIIQKLNKKSQLTYQEIKDLRLCMKEISIAIQELKRERYIILNSLKSLNMIAAAMCKKSQRKRSKDTSKQKIKTKQNTNNRTRK